MTSHALRLWLICGKVQVMARRFSIFLLPAFLLELQFVQPSAQAVQPSPAAIAGFNSYAARVENRIAGQHKSHESFVAPVDLARLSRGELVIEKISAPADISVPGAMLHHWRGTAFVPGATAADFDRLLRDFNAYPTHFAPQIIQSHILAQQGDHYQIQLRVRQKHVLTVVLDITYVVSFGALDLQHHFSASRSTRIAEVEAVGTPHEGELKPSEEHGFLWRLNSYWSYEERNGGLVIQIESISLTRSIPTGLGWVVRPFVESVPRESLEFTLHSASIALRAGNHTRGRNHDR